MVFTYDLPVPYGAIDFARIVYYPQFLHFCHMTMEAMFGAEVGIPYADVLQKEGIGYPTVSSNAAFKAPVPYGETLKMELSVLRIGSSSIDFKFAGRRASDDVLAFEVTNTQVAVDMAAWKSVSIPAHHLEAFERLRESA